MDEPTAVLPELLLLAERFCLRIEAAVTRQPCIAEDVNELRLKLGQCRNIMAILQKAFNEDELCLQKVAIRANFRVLIMNLLWVTFRARRVIDRRTFRMLVMIESSFTYLLITYLKRS